MEWKNMVELLNKIEDLRKQRLILISVMSVCVLVIIGMLVGLNKNKIYEENMLLKYKDKILLEENRRLRKYVELKDKVFVQLVEKVSQEHGIKFSHTTP